MRIVVMGAGGVGGFFGAYLAKEGHDVAFIARGAHLTAMQQGGLKLLGPDGDVILDKVEAVESASELGAPADIILFCVKLYDTETAAESLKPIVGPDTLVISLQNGVDGPDRIAAILGEEHVLGGAAYVSALIEEPGTIRYTSAMRSIVFGRLDRAHSELASAFANACNECEFKAETSADIRRTLWNKFVLLATNSALTTLTRQPAGPLYTDEEVLVVARAMMEEVVSVATAEGVTVDEDIVDRQIALSKTLPAGMYASMYHDLNRGRRMEIESLSGLIARQGMKHGLSVPHHSLVWNALKHYKDGSPA